MNVVRHTTLESLEDLGPDWDRLSGGVPFRSWIWSTLWWRHYGQAGAKNRSLAVLVVRDLQGQAVGLAPLWCQGRTLRWLGQDEVCGEYLGVLCEPGREWPVAEALADWIARPPRDALARGEAWDCLELTGVDAEDSVTGRLIAELQRRGQTACRLPAWNCWRVTLPATWDDYLAELSHNRRRQVRRQERRVLGDARTQWRMVERADELPHGRETLIALHQRRHQSLGHAGSFASPQFAAFHQDLMAELLRTGQLWLGWLERDRRPMVCEYSLAGGGMVYAYQSGIDPEVLQDSPGSLGNLLLLRRAVQQGFTALDFLRGDEPYKRYWRAEPRPMYSYRVFPSHARGRLRRRLWLAGTGVKRWLKHGLKLLDAS